MDTLTANQQLNVNDELVSNNGWFALAMFDDGALGLYRVQARLSMWASPALGRPGPGCHAR